MSTTSAPPSASSVPLSTEAHGSDDGAGAVSERSAQSSASCDATATATAPASAVSGAAAGVDVDAHDPALPAAIRFGVMCRSKKLHAKPLQRVLALLNEQRHFEFVFFEDDALFGQPVEQWPSVDVLLCFHSNGFPIRRAIRYVRLENERRRQRGAVGPLLELQDAHAQRKVLLNRLAVYTRLTDRCNVPVPRHVVVKRGHKYRVVCDGNCDAPSAAAAAADGAITATRAVSPFAQTLDELRVCGRCIRKPFVEKPIDANNHHIVVYYADGKGQRQLFRKQNDQCSAYLPDKNGVRQDGSYLYEPFHEVEDHKDIKVYCAGGSVVYAERRRSPTVDGSVARTADGFEVREEVELTAEERRFAESICREFGQFLCGFDILRLGRGVGAGGGSPRASVVCDVNGFSLPKRADDFYVRAARVMRERVLRELADKGKGGEIEAVLGEAGPARTAGGAACG